MKKILAETYKKTIVPFLLFTFIFTAYFSSSVGLINSGDTPQYFTTEALINNHNLDLRPFESDPHFFVWPDYFMINDQKLSFRGYMLSILMIPIHLLARYISPLFSYKNFATEVVVPHFKYELAVGSFFTILSASGLFFIWKSIVDITKKKYIAHIIIFITAFGSYIWKYAAYYSRHGMTVFILGLCTYSFIKMQYHDRWKHVAKLTFFLCWAISFGIDTILFISLTVIIISIYGYKLFVRKHILFKKSSLDMLKIIPPAFSIAVILICVILNLNAYWYNSIQSNQMPQSSFYFSNVAQKNRFKVILSAPIFPTLSTVLFNAGKINSVNFQNFDHLPDSIARANSLSYAKIYNFFGLFVISPILLFSVYALCFKRNIIENKALMFTLLMFLLNIIGNAKYYVFWGGNQYDIRYFYPYSILLAIPLALTIKNAMASTWFIKLSFVFILGSLSLFSIFMGWLGVINMFKPALTGERRIWMDLYDFRTDYRLYSPTEYINATFMNRANAWISVIFCILCYATYLLYKISRIKHKAR
ncbi:hypothetical protein COY90_01425 [Candidatus Roizmanbacteria bacterium CG_4_10_14_0_8_um_filter_39_9]|uniref:Glycosyltransferase RgtA/B/C/D-like domain-containing protein n=1 Tax=Candidatus Roizmanbacteria bacterium CG_4_10_14_0_8_um_filter_39_9 TaxID=1974829 RepID=A0A2M7QDK7_9BACT|nr:MAG: hypothetical protein COY90_01425 [Candidatus Roizmanbacteria bacterium CG_4_10_14_0_8_um_filter_39_9]